MTFNQVVWKMAKYHYKKYIFYLSCNTVAVMFFFMFMTIYFNEHLIAVEETEGIRNILKIPGAALIVFTVFFIGFAHRIFMKKRRSEFGLFMTLGMTKRDISKLLLIENSIVAVFALFIGIILGIIFSKFFFGLLLKSVGIEEIAFHINASMFLYSISAFILVFMVAITQSLYLTMKRNIIDNIKTEKITENTAYKHPAIGAIGVAFIIASIIGLFVTYPIYDGAYLMIWAMMTFFGLYVAINQLTAFLIGLIKKNNHLYYRNLLYLTNLDYKYKQLTSIMMLVTVMIMVTLLYSTIVFSGYMEVGKNVIERNPYDVAFISTDSKNNLLEDEVYAIFEEHENLVEEHVSIPVYFKFEKGFDGSISPVTFMPLSVFNEVTTNLYELETHELIYHLNNATEDLDSVSYGQELRFLIDGNEVLYNYNKIIGENQFNYLGEFFIINDEELKVFKENIDGLEAVAHFINLEDWEESEAAVLALENTFKNYNAVTPALDVENIQPEKELFGIDSIVNDYKNRMSTDGIQFFVIIFLCILFFFGSFILLYMQLFSEVDKEGLRIRKLYRIGITNKEVKKLLSQEITTVFMLPVLLGVIIALLYLIAMTTGMGGLLENLVILFYFSIIAGVYIVILLFILFYARRRMFREIANFKK